MRRGIDFKTARENFLNDKTILHLHFDDSYIKICIFQNSQNYKESECCYM